MSLDSSDVIRRRLLKNASSLLGIEHSELTTLDPVVSMLYGALSKELEKLYQEQSTSRSRVLDRLSTLLLPEVSAGAFPSHGVLYTRPYEKTHVLSKTSQFYFRKKRKASESSYRDDFFDVYFAPIDDTQIINASVKYFVSASGLFKTADIYLKDKVAELNKSSVRWSKSSCWIGLDIDELKETTLHEISFFIDWPAHPERKRLLDILPYVKAYCNGLELDAKVGNSMVRLPKSDADLMDNFGLYSSNQKALRAHYQKHFISVSSADALMFDPVIPQEFSSCFGDDSKSKIQGSVLWIKLEFPPFMATELLDEMVCVINAVPVCNLRLHEFSFRIQPNFNIVPLDVSEEFFYQIISVKSVDGKDYVTSSVEDSNKVGKGEYIVRRGGVERFDQRNAEQLLGYLVDLLKDESAAFSIFGHEAISTDLNALNQQIASLNHKVRAKSTNKETANYIMVQPRSNSDTVFVEYWTTAGDMGNDIRLGAPLLLSSSADVRTGEVVMLCNVTGGRDPRDARNSLKSFKSALTNRDRIVTIADIVTFCEDELGDHVAKVDVKMVYALSPERKSGFRKVIKVLVKPEESSRLTADEWEAHIFNLKAKIESRSPFVHPIDVVTDR